MRGARLDEGQVISISNYAVAFPCAVKPTFPLMAESVATQPPASFIVIAVVGPTFDRSVRFNGNCDREFIVTASVYNEITLGAPVL